MANTAGPANARLIQNIYLEPEPRGARMAARLAAYGQRALRGRESPVTERHDGEWHGPTQNPQNFAGLASRAAAARAAVPSSSTIGDERSSTYDDPALRIFRDRSARRRR